MARIGPIAAGTTFAKRYRIGERLPGASTTEPYHAERLADGARMVLRFVHPWLLDDRAFITEAFVRVARAKEASSEHVVAIDDFGESRGGEAWIATAFAEPRFRDVYDGPGLPWPRVVAIAGAIARAYTGARAAGVPSLRISPRQLYGDDGALRFDAVGSYLAGSGARRKHPDEVGGTVVGRVTPDGDRRLETMSPEQLMGARVDERSAVYSLGVIVHRLAVGALPFPDAHGAAGLITAQLKTVPAVPLEGPGRDVLLRALAKAPADRYDGVTGFVAALEAAR